MILYHGSPNYYNVLESHISTHGKAAVYAAPDINFALCYAGNPWNDTILNQSYYDKVLYLTELKFGIFEKIYDRDGFIYEIDDSSNQFTYVNNNSTKELWCFNPVKYCKIIYFNNTLMELKNSSVIMIRYPNKPKWWKLVHKED